MQRNRIQHYTQAALLALAITLAISPAGKVVTSAIVNQAHAGELDLSDAQNAKLARHKAKERVSKNEAQKDYSVGAEDTGSGELNEEECGTVDIGNVVNEKGFGGPKQIDVIVTGDIINANNDCN